jgi:uncharacterized coiled-coil DUF342 family protein
MTTTRHAMVTKLKDGLDQWNKEIDALEETVRKRKAAVEEEYAERMSELKQKRDEAIQKLQKIKGAASDAGQGLESGSKEIWSEIKHTLKESKDAFFEGLDEDKGKKS